MLLQSMQMVHENVNETLEDTEKAIDTLSDHGQHALAGTLEVGGSADSRFIELSHSYGYPRVDQKSASRCRIPAHSVRSLSTSPDVWRVRNDARKMAAGVSIHFDARNSTVANPPPQPSSRIDAIWPATLEACFNLDVQ